jgi:hypothetical protein
MNSLRRVIGALCTVAAIPLRDPKGVTDMQDVQSQKTRSLRTHWQFVALSALVAGAAASCSSVEPTGQDDVEDLGEAEVALTNSPTDVSCLRVKVTGTRTDTRSFPLTAGQKVVFRLTGLPVGTDTFSAEAFSVSCANVRSSVNPTWVSEPVTEKVVAGKVTHVALLMIHNGLTSVGVDFGEGNAPKPGVESPLSGGFRTPAPAYLVPTPGSNVKVYPIITAGETANLKPDNVTPYRMVGIPDGLGAIDNGDGTITVLMNQELGATVGVARLHGGLGSFVSKWTIRKADFAVTKGEDLMSQVLLWNGAAYAAAATAAFGRFCSATLPERSALFDAASGLGYDGDLFFNGEETGNEGKGMVHAMDGTSWDVPRLGKMAWENSVANPGTGQITVVAGLDDTTPSATVHGEVYFYYGTKTNTGTPIERAGLTNGRLYGLRVVGQPNEVVATGIPAGAFDLYDFGNVASTTGTALSDASIANNVTGFNRPEDGAWDPNNPNDFYFVTTASFANPSRLWRARFVDAGRPDLGGQIEMLLDGTEGQHMLDNLTVDQYGHVYLVEDVGGNDHIGKVWRYDIASDSLTTIAQCNPDLFTPGSPNFLTNDEEASGIVDAADILGPGWFLVDVQSHKASADPELVEGGQLLAFFDPASAG